MNIVIVANDQLINKMKRHYHDKIDTDSNIPHTNFVVSDSEYKIIVYNTNKVMFQGSNARSEASLWENKQTNNNRNCMISINSSEQIGSDEVGTGDYIGPVIVCASYVNDQLLNELRHLNLDDSKKIKDDYILEIGPTLIEKVIHVVYILDNEKYNEAIKQNNLNKIKAKMHNHVICKLTNHFKNKVDVVLDQFCDPTKYFEYLKDMPIVYKDIHFETKAESKYLSVAISSIIARYTFLLEMDKLSSIYKTNLLKGASHLVDEQVASLVEEYGYEVLDKLVKKHFANTNKVEEILQNKLEI